MVSRPYLDSPLRVLGLQQRQVGLPLVADDLAAAEAAEGDDHLGDVDGWEGRSR